MQKHKTTVIASSTTTKMFYLTLKFRILSLCFFLPTVITKNHQGFKTKKFKAKHDAFFLIKFFVIHSKPFHLTKNKHEAKHKSSTLF